VPAMRARPVSTLSYRIPVFLYRFDLVISEHHLPLVDPDREERVEGVG